ncbi:MAG: 3-keto-5-aminohexanoate cleavage protein [Actinomycetota bacterium]
MEPLIVTVAGIGAEITREQQPGLPITADEIAEDAAACEASGACIYHLHVRTRAGAPTMDVGIFRAAFHAIQARTDLIVQFTSGGAVTDGEDVRIAPLALRPPMASLTTGTVNFGDEVFWNPMPLVVRFYTRMRELGIAPEFEIFEPGMLANAERVYQEHGDGHHCHYDFVLGVPGAMPAWMDSVTFLAQHVPGDATWSATGIGRSHPSVTEAAISLGGHVRTGFEDVRYLGPGEPARSNSQLVDRVVDAARRTGRPLASPGEARELLGLMPGRGTLTGSST